MTDREASPKRVLADAASAPIGAVLAIIVMAILGSGETTSGRAFSAAAAATLLVSVGALPGVFRRSARETVIGLNGGLVAGLAFWWFAPETVGGRGDGVVELASASLLAGIVLGAGLAWTRYGGWSLLAGALAGAAGAVTFLVLFLISLLIAKALVWSDLAAFGLALALPSYPSALPLFGILHACEKRLTARPPDL